MIGCFKKFMLLIPALAMLGACSALKRDLAEEPPPLVDMEAPLDLQDEPEDEDMRVKLAKGAFTGVYVKEGAESLDEMLDEEGGNGVVVDRVVENSPAAAAGVKVGDILLEATVDGGETQELSWPSEWRQIELNGKPGGTVKVLLDRAGQDFETAITFQARIAPAERSEAATFREEQKVGIVVRTATEVESRNAGLGPGGGAVVVGLSKASPWRDAGLRFKDMIVAIDDKPVAHPQVLFETIKAKNPGDSVDLQVRRGAETLKMAAKITERAGQFESFSIPLLYSYEAKGESVDTSLLFGLFGYEETAAAWEVTILWFISFGGGDSDELEEVDS